MKNILEISTFSKKHKAMPKKPWVTRDFITLIGKKNTYIRNRESMFKMIH